jgi:hypothetical protein
MASNEWQEGRLDGRRLLGKAATGGRGGPGSLAPEIGCYVHGTA